MKRIPLQRKTELKRSVKRLTAKTPMRARKAGKPRRRVGACRPYLDWLKTGACCITGKHTGEHYVTDSGIWYIVVDPAHVRTRRNNGDLWNALSLTRHLHEEQHRIGIKSFAAKYGVDLKAMAVAQTEQWLETDEGQAWAAHPGSAA